MNTNLVCLNDEDLEVINGGSLTLTIMGVTFYGWKAGVLIGAGVTTLVGAAGFGFYNGSK